MDNLVWGGVPTQRKRKGGEQYTNPVFTMAAIAKGSGRKISFNKAAQTALGIQPEDYVTFGFDAANNRIFVAKSSADVKGAIQLTKTCTLSNKRIFEYIVKAQGLNEAVENTFNLVTVEGEPYLEAIYRSSGEITPSVAETETASEVGVTALGDAPSETEAAPVAETTETETPTTEATSTSTNEDEAGW